MKKYIVLFTAGLSFLAGNAQEQPHYLFYMLQQPIINPAAMGTFDQVNGAALFHAQLVGFNGAPIYGMLDVGAPIGKSNAYIGGQVQQDHIGVNNRTFLGGSFAYRFRLKTQHYLSLGLTAGAEMFQSNLTNAAVQDPGDPVYSQNVQSVWAPNFKLGTYYFADNMYVGFSVGNLLTNRLRLDGTQPGNTIQFSGKGMHFYLNGGWQKKFAKVWKFQPSVLVKYIYGAPIQIDINTQFVFKEQLGFGISYRTASTLVVQANYTIAKSFILAYAASLGLAYRDRANFSGHEVMFAFRVKSKRQILPVDVPRF